jgi:hypothetical protein
MGSMGVGRGGCGVEERWLDSVQPLGRKGLEVAFQEVSSRHVKPLRQSGAWLSP